MHGDVILCPSPPQDGQVDWSMKKPAFRATEPLERPQSVRWARPFSAGGDDDVDVEAMIEDGDRLGLIKRVGRRLVEYDRRE